MRAPVLLGIVVLHFSTLSTATPAAKSDSGVAASIAPPRSSLSTSRPKNISTKVPAQVHTHSTVPRPAAIPTHPHVPPPAQTIARGPDAPDSTGPQRPPVHHFPSHKVQPVAIAFAVLGGLVLSGFLFGFIRCFYNYNRTPKRDRIADVLQRHHLQRELEELERNPRALRPPSLREPAPPYFPRPPSYEDGGSIPTSPMPTNGQPYAELSRHSPPPTPPMASLRSLMPSSPATRIPDSLPRIPQG